MGTIKIVLKGIKCSHWLNCNRLKLKEDFVFPEGLRTTHFELKNT